ncbi:MAG: LacI family DNA-binding transcriptional regulator [Anaerolineales bacterium]|nr:LacI family DNA-binding transcriptional regulator [Anaerolineales bacterium]
MNKKVTIKDVAAAAGVSHQTVSRVMNDRPDVARETRQRVWQVIEDLDYQPSAIARSLSRQHSFTLGVVTAGLKYIGPSRTLNGITVQAEELGYALLLKELPGFHTVDIKPILNFLVSRHVDGIIWAVPEIGANRERLQQQLNGLSIPVILLTMSAREGMFIVAVDNYLGGRMATEHLLEQGYRHIGHITGPLDWWEARQRKAGWHDALQEAGIPAIEHNWTSGDWSSASGQKAMLQMLENYPQMDALFIANDQMALGALQIICKHGIKVPDDLAMVGFDNLPESEYFSPPLTTVRQNLRQLGNTAVRELVRIIDVDRLGEQAIEPKVITLHPELIVRESSIRRKSHD